MYFMRSAEYELTSIVYNYAHYYNEIARMGCFTFQVIHETNCSTEGSLLHI